MKNYFLAVSLTLLFSNAFLYSIDHELVISAVKRGDIKELEGLKARGVNIGIEPCTGRYSSYTCYRC